MKTKWCWTLLLILAVAAIPVFAEQGKPLTSPAPITGFSIKNDHSAPLRDLAKAYKRPAVVPPHEIAIHKLDMSRRGRPSAGWVDPLVRPIVPRGPMPTPIITFEGGDDDQNQLLVGTRYVPPDTNGDVGPNHYVQYINTVINIYDKTTGTEAPGFPVAGNALWVGFGGPCESTDQGDPTVIYDQFTGRWVFTQFVITQGQQCIAVSQTSDPTGAYNRYQFGVSNGENDYPKMGNWSDAYYQTFNEFTPGFNGVVAVAYEKAKMVQGLPAQMVKFPVTEPAGPGCNGNGECYFSLQPSHLEGLTPPPAGAPNYFVMSYDGATWSTPPDPTADGYRIWQFHVDWTTPANSTFTGPVGAPSAQFNANLCGFGPCAPELGGEALDTLSQFTMYRAAYRNRSGTESLYVSHSVNVGNNQAGVRWAEIQSPGSSPTVFQAGTHAPDSLHRWMGSINADQQGNIAIGYSISSSSTYPAIGYAGRLAGDPLGTLPQTETVLFAGLGSQTGSFNRWGDYSSMSIDKSDDCTFWYTQEYYPTTGSFAFHTRIGSFKFPSCTSGPTGTLNGNVSSTGGVPIAGANIQIGSSFSTSTDAAGNYSILIPTGTYDVTASHFGYASQTAPGVVVSDGLTTTQNFVLVPNASITIDGFVTDGSGGSMPLYARIDVTNSGGSFTLFTNPLNGYYAFSAFVGTPYTITATAQIAGYVPQTRNVNTGSVDIQESFALTVNQASCNAPGYVLQNLGTVLSNDFSSGVPPIGWTVTSNTSNCGPSSTYGWTFPDPEGQPNRTGGSGIEAVANSDFCASFGGNLNIVNVDTSLVSPPIDLTAFQGSVKIQYNSDYFDWAGCNKLSGASVELDIWNGTGYTRLSNFCGASRFGPRLETAFTNAGDGAMSNIRFRYHTGWDFWWQVDNVNVSLSACTFTNGGLIFGNINDQNTGLALNGATVSLDTGQSVTSGPTPNDPNIGDGFYYIYAPTIPGNSTGVRTMTVSKANYGTVTLGVIPTPRGSVSQNFNLPAGMFSVQPSAMRMRLPIAGTGDSNLTLTNTGTLAATFNLIEVNAPPPAARPAGPFDQQVLSYDPTTKAGFHASVARDGRNIPPRLTQNVPAYPRSGEFVNSFNPQMTYPWGAGFDYVSSHFWASDLGGFFGGTFNDTQFNLDGSKTGVSFLTTPAGGSWAGDMAYDAITNKFWQVNVGGNDCIFEFDPSGSLTGNKICPAFGTSERGLAFDVASGHFYAGSWNDFAIKEFAQDGTIIRNVNVNLAVSGLAFNATTKHLFVQVNASPQKIFILDAATPGLTVLGSFILKDSAGNNAFNDFEGAGLEMDCTGNLWSVRQDTFGLGRQQVFINGTGEAGACGGIPWVSENPTSGTVAPGASATSDFTFTTAGQNPGCEEAQVLITNNTPYGTPIEVVALTTQFNDVPLGTFGDFFIHGIAGAGISFGCGAGNFCPNDLMTRRLMPVWLLRGKFGRFYQPPPAVGIFADVSPESFAADWIEDLYNRGITAGCATNPLRYCPENPVTRGQMAVFLLATKEASGYQPPACTGIFADVPCPSGFANWIEEIYNRGITAGCATNPLRYCPADSVNRSQMSVFESVNFGIPKCNQ